MANLSGGEPMSEWTNPMPAGVSLTIADGLVYACATCKTREVIGRAPYPSGKDFLGEYDALQKRAWDHNYEAHVAPAAAKSRRKRAGAVNPLFAAWKPPIPAGATQSSIFELLGV